jgi:ABC-type arginine/histidine transport system permease subunit
MTALAIVIARALFKESSDTRTLKLLALFCGTGLLVSLLLIVYGFVFSPDFF